MIIILICLFSLFLISILKYKKVVKVELKVIKDVDNIYVETYVKKTDFDNLLGKKLVFKTDEIVYEVIKIEDYYFLDTEYKKIIMKIVIDDFYLKENNVLLMEFIKGETTLIDEVINYIKKGISG